MIRRPFVLAYIMVLHNAIADYRDRYPDATSTPLYRLNETTEGR